MLKPQQYISNKKMTPTNVVKSRVPLLYKKIKLNKNKKSTAQKHFLHNQCSISSLFGANTWQPKRLVKVPSKHNKSMQQKEYVETKGRTKRRKWEAWMRMILKGVYYNRKLNKSKITQEWHSLTNLKTVSDSWQKFEFGEQVRLIHRTNVFSTKPKFLSFLPELVLNRNRKKETTHLEW